MGGGKEAVGIVEGSQWKAAGGGEGAERLS